MTATAAQGRDTGMALVLLLLIGAAATGRAGLVLAAIVLQALAMTAPGLFRPAAVVWFGLSRVLGAVMSRVILAVVFFGLVTPVGVLRRLLGRDDLRLREFRAGTGSVFAVRDHACSARDLERPY